MNLDRLRAFTVFADHLNFTHAAQALNMSQPTLHAQVNQLADTLGVVLYIRQGRQLVLTENGRRTARFGRQIGEQVRAFGDQLLGLDDQQPAVLAAGEGSFLYLLGPAIRAFTQSFSTPIRLIRANAEQCIDAVRAGRAHLGVASLDQAPEDLDYEVLCRVPQVLHMPTCHVLAQKMSISLRDLEDATLVLPPPNRPLRQTLDRALSAANIRVHVGVEAEGWPSILHFAQLGLGLAVTNGFCPAPSGFTRRTLVDLPERVYYLLRRQRMIRPATQALETLLRTHRDDWLQD